MIQNSKADIKPKKVLHKSNSYIYFFFRISIRMTFYFFLILSSLLLLYIVGNYQEFLVETQRLLLNLIAVASVIEGVFSILTISLNLATFFLLKRRVRKLLLYIFVHLLTLAVSVGAFFISRAVLLLSNGL